MSLDAPLLHVGLAAWIIQDGNHGDFTVGQRAKFALELCPLGPLRPAPPGPLAAEHLGAARYRVRGRVAFASPRAWVLDAGAFLALQQGRGERPRAGTLVQGEVYLGVDPFFYPEELHGLPGLPPLSYRWRVRELQLERTPWREATLPGGQRVRERDASRERFEPVAATDAWNDDGGNGHYLLGCVCEGGPEAP